MRTLIVGLMAVFCSVSSAVFNVGDTIPDSCYETLGGGKFCHSYAAGAIRVVINNAGWCPPCNSEVSELSQKVPGEFNPLEVVFVSLSAEGYSRGSKPDQAFLSSWQKKHNIPFIVAGEFKNFGKPYFSSPSIPNVAIIDQNDKLAWKAVGPSVESIFFEVKKLLGRN